jgi:hypothetical protein
MRDVEHDRIRSPALDEGPQLILEVFGLLPGKPWHREISEIPLARQPMAGFAIFQLGLQASLRMRDQRLDHCSRRYGCIGRGSGRCHIDARAGGEGVTENRDVSGHTNGKAELQKLRAVRNPIILQNGGWNGRRARLVRGLCEEAGNRIHRTPATGAARFRAEPFKSSSATRCIR